MRRNMFKLSITALLAGIVFLAGTTLSVYAHDPAGSSFPDQSHIHIKGRITTPEGKGIPGLKVEHSGNTTFQGNPPECGLAGFSPGLPTDANGQYDMFIAVKTITQTCRNAFDSITIDKTKLIIKKSDGSQPPYDFKIK